MKSPTLARLGTMVLTLALLTFSGAGFSAGGNYSSDFDFEPVMKLIAEEKYQLAIDMLHDELDGDPDNPDIMSLLGFSYRKTQKFENALTFYQWPLKAEPDHRGANEYLGEFYLETNQFD
jgi:tetratricopeptide (TPR) repeat protein